jgi:dipeptidyl-peptidase 4
MKYKPIFFLAAFLFAWMPVSSQQLDLELIFKQHLFYPERVEGIRSMADGRHYTTLADDRHILRHDYRTGEVVDTLFSLDEIEYPEISDISSYSVTDDGSVILFSTAEEKIYRYSFQADFYVYRTAEKVLIPVFSEGKQKIARLSPDGKYVAFVFENNLYLKDLLTSKITRVTTDGLKNHILNGEPDWVYEEEFTLKTGFYWSPDSRKLAYYRIDESDVREYYLLIYDSIYPEPVSYKYPKAGETNSQVDICIYDLNRGTTTRMITGPESDRYIPRIKWLPNSGEICITELNRLQNQANLYIADISSGKSHNLYTEINEKFISEFTDDFASFTDSGKNVLIMSERSGFMHIYRYTIEGNFINAVTSGEWDVDEILGIDEAGGVLYYTSTEISPLERHIYRINFDGTGKEKISGRKGTSTAVFSRNFEYYIQTWSDANTPYVTELYNMNGDLIRVLENNNDLLKLTSYYHFTEKQFFTIKNKEGQELNCYRILPHDFREKSKYPVVVYVYGGPESQEVMDKWDRELPWMQYLAGQGYIIVCTDNRGTDGRGEAFKKSTYLQLGKLETEDQIALAEYMAQQSYVNAEQIGIFGWSYGGFMSLLCLTKGNHIFKSGVAVAPVTNWKFYDSVYTERFMRKPSENAEGYEANSPISFIDLLSGDLLIIHGSGDDNVHFQNSVELMDELVRLDKKFEFSLYPDQNHNMDQGNARYHLYCTVDRFFNRSLK